MATDERTKASGLLENGEKRRVHRRRVRLSEGSAALLEEYQEAMRLELRSLLEEIRARHARLPLPERAKRWELAIRLARELGSAVDAPSPSKPPAEVTAINGRRRSAIDFG